MLNQGGINYKKQFFLLLAGITLLRLFYIREIELAPDEAYYWTWSKQLQWGYYDHPPLVAFLIWFFTKLAGDGEWGVRLGWVIMATILTYIIYRLGKDMFKSTAVGFYSALFLNIILLTATGAIIATPDGPQGFFWVWAIYLLWHAVDKGQKWLWYGVGAALGLGLLAKYTMILLIPCAFFFLLSYPQGRKLLKNKEPYLALLIGILIFAPVILWNYRHDWVSFRMQLSHGLEIKESAGWKTFGDFWGGQAGVVSPLLFLLLIWAMGQSFLKGFAGQPKFLLLFWTSAPVLSFFAYTSWRSKVEANWPALAYLAAIIALAGIIEEKWPRWQRVTRGVIWAGGLMAFLFTLLGHLQPLYALVPLPAAKDPTSQLYGWRTLGERIKKMAESIDQGGKVFLLTPHHQLVGEGMFYTQRKYPIYQWNAPLRINNLSLANAPQDGYGAIFFTENQEDLPKEVASLFNSCEKLETLKIWRTSEVVRTHPMWKCQGFKRQNISPPA